MLESTRIVVRKDLDHSTISYALRHATHITFPYLATYTHTHAHIYRYLGGNSVNAIGAILTDFFLCAYALVNASQFFLALSRAPNYRPTFKCVFAYHLFTS
jgi:hypothetical protein